MSGITTQKSKNYTYKTVMNNGCPDLHRFTQTLELMAYEQTEKRLTTKRKENIMSLRQQYVELPGSDRTALSNARQIGSLDPDERIEVSVYLRSRSPSPPLADMTRQIMPHQQRRLSRKEYAEHHGVHPEDFAKVEEFARSQNLEIVEKEPARRVLKLAGTVAAITAAFDVELHRYEHTSGIYRGRTGPLKIPQHLASIIETVNGIDNRPQFKLGRKYIQPRDVTTCYTPLQIANIYNFPKLGNGTGQCIGIVAFGGGYLDSDLSEYFQQLGIPKPNVSSVSVDGEQNQPNVNSHADGELAIDIQVVGAVAPGAKIVVYFAPNTAQGFIDAVTTAVHDTSNKPSVISISWGAPESIWPDQTIQALNQVFQDAATLGVTICCASGDSGSHDNAGDGLAYVNFPASSPYVLSCGGTRLNSDDSETVWNDDTGITGGGVSDKFPLPNYQAGVNVPSSSKNGRVGRGVPDVAGNASFNTGYQVTVKGQTAVGGGTSAVAPLWAGLIALINQHLGQPVGFLNPFLYQNTHVLRDVTTGNNGVYQAGQGWDACTGLGTPNGSNLLTSILKNLELTH